MATTVKATETVSIDRDALVDVLTATVAAVEVIADFAPEALRHFMDELDRKANVVAKALGEEAQEAIWRDGERRARAIVNEFSSELTERLGGAPLTVKMLAWGLVERELALRETALALGLNDTDAEGGASGG